MGADSIDDDNGAVEWCRDDNDHRDGEENHDHDVDEGLGRVPAAIVKGDTMMNSHLLQHVSAAEGSTIRRAKPSVGTTPLGSTQSGQIVPLMGSGARYGTTAGYVVAVNDVVAKTGTAQADTTPTDDWMNAFAPTIAVVLSFQAIEKTGALVAGTIMTCLVEGARSVQSGHPASGAPGTCPR